MNVYAVIYCNKFISIHVFPCANSMQTNEMRSKHDKHFKSVCIFTSNTATEKRHTHTHTELKSMNISLVYTHKISYYIFASLQFRFIKLDLKMFRLEYCAYEFVYLISHTRSHTLSFILTLVTHAACAPVPYSMVHIAFRCVFGYVACIKFIEYKVA